MIIRPDRYHPVLARQGIRMSDHDWIVHTLSPMERYVIFSYNKDELVFTEVHEAGKRLMGNITAVGQKQEEMLAKLMDKADIPFWRGELTSNQLTHLHKYRSFVLLYKPPAQVPMAPPPSSNKRYIIIPLEEAQLLSKYITESKPTVPGAIKPIVARFNAETGADIEDIVKQLKSMDYCIACSVEGQQRSCESPHANKLGRRLSRLVDRANRINLPPGEE